jgi:hypothetical protein
VPFEIDRALYARMYGPTVGDRVRLGDTNLLVEVERDDASPGDETLWGFGNPVPDSMRLGRSAGPPSPARNRGTRYCRHPKSQTPRRCIGRVEPCTSGRGVSTT